MDWFLYERDLLHERVKLSTQTRLLRNLSLKKDKNFKTENNNSNNKTTATTSKTRGVYLGPCQASMIELFCEKFIGFYSLNIKFDKNM